MAEIEWVFGTASGDVGISKAVLYLPGDVGIPWNGLVSVADKSAASVSKLIYLDGVNVGLIQDNKDFAVTVAAYTYPDKFSKFTGYEGVRDKQYHPEFGLSYLTGDSNTGQIHLVYNATARSVDRSWKTKTNNTDLTLFKWDITTRPEMLSGSKPTAHFVIDLATTPQDTIEDLSNELYGTSSTDPTLPSLTRIFEIYEQNARFQVIDNSELNGTWTVNAVDEAITFVDANTVELTWPTVVAETSEVYTLSTGF